MYVLPHCGRSISFPFQNISGIQEDIKDCLLICYCDIGCIFLRDLSALRNIIILNGKKNFSAESFCLSPGIFLPDNICLIQEELPPEVCVQSLEAGFLKQLPDRLEQPIYSLSAIKTPSFTRLIIQKRQRLYPPRSPRFLFPSDMLSRMPMHWKAYPEAPGNVRVSSAVPWTLCQMTSLKLPKSSQEVCHSCFSERYCRTDRPAFSPGVQTPQAQGIPFQEPFCRDFFFQSHPCRPSAGLTDGFRMNFLFSLPYYPPRSAVPSAQNRNP